MNSSGVRIEATCATPGCGAPRDRRLAGFLLVLLPTIAAMMSAFGFRRTYNWLQRLSAATSARRGARDAAHLAAVVVHINRHVLPYQTRCLLESTALWYLLRRNGYRAELLLGARTLLGPLEAHAWVELDGDVLNDSVNVRDIYEPFDLAAATARPEAP